MYFIRSQLAQEVSLVQNQVDMPQSHQNHIYQVVIQCLPRRRAISIRMALLSVIHPALTQARVRNHMGPLIASGPQFTRAKVQNHTSLPITRAKVQNHTNLLLIARLQSHRMSPSQLNIQLYQMLHQFLQILLISYATVQQQHTLLHHFQRKFLSNLI